MRNLRLVLEYDGSAFAGWQVQPGQRTVQGELEAALTRLTGEKIAVCVAGRTDAGVHALGQVVSFYTGSALAPYVFVGGLNRHLPGDVAVLRAEDAPESFNAKRDAVGKWYRYLIRDGSVRMALERDRAWRITHRLDLEAMRAAAACLIGEHDFSSFRSATCEATSPVKEMRRLELYRDGAGRLVIDLWASAFLKQMVRAIAGTLAETGEGKRRAEDMPSVLSARDRRTAGATAPAQGLYLLRVDYREETK